MMSIKRTFDILDWMLIEYPSNTALVGHSQGEWIKYSSEEYINIVNRVSVALLELGLKRGDKIATVSNSRPEWNFLDMGMSQIGVVHVPLYPNLTKEEYSYLLNHSDARVVFSGNKVLHDRLKPALSGCENVERYYTVDRVEGESCFQDLLELGDSNFDSRVKEVEQIKSSISEEDLLSIIYTSGTTGVAKGVMLSHRAIVSNVKATAGIHNESYSNGGVNLSLLPLCHIYERMINYHMQYKGVSIWYARNMGTVLADLGHSKATIFTTVPRFLEKVYDGIISKGKDLSGFKKMIFFWAVNMGLKFDSSKESSLYYRLKLKLARKLIFSKWVEALGGSVKVIVTGGAACQERLCRVFNATGITVIEGYGLTETAPVIAANKVTPGDSMIGTVGPITEGVEVKIAEDGEILCKGPNIMMGYYKDPEYTDEVLTKDGWFHTGDIGTIIDDKFLKITDRKKSIFKLSSGKYIAPQSIENRVKESLFIEQAMVVGENQKYVAAILTLDLNYIHFWAAKHKVKYRNNIELVDNSEVKARIRKEVHRINKLLSPHEHIKKTYITADEWGSATGELSATLKLKREVISEKYKSQIEQLHGA